MQHQPPPAGVVSLSVICRHSQRQAAGLITPATALHRTTVAFFAFAVCHLVAVLASALGAAILGRVGITDLPDILMAANTGTGVVVHAAPGNAAIILILFFLGLGRIAVTAVKADGDTATATAVAVVIAAPAVIVVIIVIAPTAAVIIAAAATAIAAAAVTAIIAAVTAVICLGTRYVAAGAILGKFIQLCQTLGVAARILDHAEQHLTLLHIAEIARQVLIIVTHLHLIIDRYLDSTAKALGLLDADLAHAEALTGQLAQDLLQQGVMTALIQAETTEHFFIYLTLSMLHQTAVIQLGFPRPHHHFLKNILDPHRTVALTLTIVIKRYFLAATKSSGHNMDLLISLYGVFIL